MSGQCYANLNLSDDEFMITCDRGRHNGGLHHWEPRDLWWYSNIWRPVIPAHVLTGTDQGSTQ